MRVCLVGISLFHGSGHLLEATQSHLIVVPRHFRQRTVVQQSLGQTSGSSLTHLVATAHTHTHTTESHDPPHICITHQHMSHCMHTHNDQKRNRGVTAQSEATPTHHRLILARLVLSARAERRTGVSSFR